MSSTSSTAHRRDFCRALYLQPSPEKLGRAGNICCARPSDRKLGRGAWVGLCLFRLCQATATLKGQKRQKGAKADLLITNFSRLSLSLRQRKCKLQAAHLAILNLDVAAVEDNTVLHNRESETCATELA